MKLVKSLRKRTVLKRMGETQTPIMVCKNCGLPHEIGIKCCIYCQGKLLMSTLITKDNVLKEYLE